MQSRLGRLVVAVVATLVILSLIFTMVRAI